MRLLVLLTLVASLAPSAWAQQKTGAVYIFADGAPADLTADMTEVLISNLAEGSELAMLPKEKFLQRTQQVSDRYADQCLREPDCVLRVGTGLNLSLIAVGFLQMQGDGYRLKVTRYSLTGGDDQPFTYDGLPDVPKLIASVKDLAGNLREAEGAVLTLTGDNAGGTVFIDDKFIGVLPLKSISVSDGFHKLLIRKKDFEDFRSKVSCKTGTRCEVPVDLRPVAAGATTAAMIEPAAGGAEPVVEPTGADDAPATNRTPWRVLSGVGMGVGGAALGAGVYFLVPDKKNTTVGTALLASGGAIFVASTAWLIYLYASADPSSPPPTGMVLPTVAPGYAGLSASFAF